MAFSKVILNDETLMDVTTDTVEASNLLTGNTATAASGQKVSGAYVPSNDFIITLTQNQSGDWEPDCTFAEAFAAYNAGKNLAGKAGDYNSVSITYSDDNSAFVVLIEEGFQDDLQNWGVINKGYFWSSSGMELDEDSRYYSTELADAVPTNVLSGKKFYNANGYQVGTIVTKTSSDLTASGATVTVPAGYYASQASKSVATTTHPSPSINLNSTTGTVTASHTQTTGYVTGGTTTGTLQLPYQSAKTVTPTESEQTAVNAGVYTLGAVKVGAISSTYVGSGISQNDSDDLTASGATVTVPAGYYAEDASKTIASGSATVSATITTNPTISVGSDGLITASVNSSVGVSPTVTAGYISTGTAGTITARGSKTSQLTTQAATTITPTESEQTAVAAGRYTTGIVKVGAISSTYVGSGIAQNDSDDLTVSGATVTAPAGYYAEDATKTIASGSARTPDTTLTANPVNSIDYTNATITSTVNASQNVTPTVTAGYVSSGTSGTVTIGGTKTSTISTKTSNIVPTSETQVITPNTTGNMFHNVASTNTGTNSTSSQTWDFVDGTQYIFQVTLRAINRSTSEVYEELSYSSLIAWDGAWSAPVLPKGSATHYPIELTVTSTARTVKWNEENSDTSFYYSIWAYEVASANSFISSVTVYPIPKINELVSLLSDYDIVTEGATMNDVYNGLVAFFSAVESGGYTYGSALLESAGSRLMTSDSDILNDDQTIVQTDNGDGSYTISYK